MWASVPIFRVNNHSTRSADDIGGIPICELSCQQLLLVTPIQLHHVKWAVIRVRPVQLPAAGTEKFYWHHCSHVFVSQKTDVPCNYISVRRGKFTVDLNTNLSMYRTAYCWMNNDENKEALMIFFFFFTHLPTQSSARPSAPKRSSSASVSLSVPSRRILSIFPVPVSSQ